MTSTLSGNEGGAGLSPSSDGRAMTELLMRLSETRDKQAFARLFEHFAPRLKSYMMKLGTHDSLAEELAQETMVSVWRKADKFDPSKSAASTWIFTIARNLRIDALRRINRPELDPDEPALEWGSAPDGFSHTSEQEDTARVQAAISGLPANQAEVVQLSFFENMSHSEIADALDIPLGTVKSRLRLAFKSVREALGNER